MRALRYGDTINISPNLNSGAKPCAIKVSPMLSFIRELSSGAIPTPGNGRIGCTIDPTPPLFARGQGISIKKYGKTPSAPYQRDMKSITRTVIPLITRWGIWSVYGRLSTIRFTPLRLLMNAASSCAKISTRHESQRPHGIVPRKGVSGIARWANTLGKFGSPRNGFANTAANRMSPRRVTDMSDFAPTNASQQPVLPAALTTRLVSARAAVRLSPAINTTKIASVPVRVVRSTAVNQSHAVYNLTIRAAVGEYYANGVLVHNCDAFRYWAWVRGRQ